MPTTSCGQPADRSFTPHSPFRTARGTWLRPEIEAEIKFTEWTAGGLLRHAEFVDSKAVHHASSKHAEVTVPSLDDWEKEWKKNPQAVMQPKVVALNFKSPAPDAASSSEAQATALAQVGWHDECRLPSHTPSKKPETF